MYVSLFVAGIFVVLAGVAVILLRNPLSTFNTKKLGDLYGETGKRIARSGPPAVYAFAGCLVVCFGIVMIVSSFTTPDPHARDSSSSIEHEHDAPA